jgi:hypothetical protein
MRRLRACLRRLANVLRKKQGDEEFADNFFEDPGVSPGSGRAFHEAEEQLVAEFRAAVGYKVAARSFAS